MPDELVTEILAGPAGPRVGAFVDYDGTIIDGYSVTAFVTDRLRRFQLTPGEAARTCCWPPRPPASRSLPWLASSAWSTSCAPSWRPRTAS